jgi:hypothetical protein
MAAPGSISEYLQVYGNVLGDRVLAQFPPLHNPDDPIWPELHRLKRRPFPAQTLAIMGISKRWQQARCAAAVAECGTGKTLISLGGVFTHSAGRQFTCLAMVPPQLEKWARECFTTLHLVARCGSRGSGTSPRVFVGEGEQSHFAVVRSRLAEPRCGIGTRGQ